MKIIFLIALLPMTLMAQKHFSYLGVNVGTSFVDSTRAGEKDTKSGLYYGGAFGHEIRFDNRINLNLGVDYNIQKLETALDSITFEKVYLDSKYALITLNPTYEVNDRFDLGLKGDFALGNDGILVSQSESAKLLYGINAFYNIPKEHNKMRIGLAIQKANTDTSYFQAGLTFQYAFGYKAKKKIKKPVEKEVVKVVEKEVVKVVQKEVFLISFGDNVVNFSSGSAKVKKKSAAFLSELGDYLAKNSVYEGIEVVGHTSMAGKARLNKKLSLRRAKAVAKILEKSGVSAEKLKVFGFGEEKPLVKPERTRKDRMSNRRVELKFIKMQEDGKLREFIETLKNKYN